MPKENVFHALWRQNRKMPVAIAVLLALNIFGWWPAGRILAPRVEEARRALEQEQERQRRQLEREEAVPGAVGYLQGREEIDRFRKSLLRKDQLTLFLSEVYSLARAAGLDIDRISYDPEQVGEQHLLRYTLNFSVAGSYAQVKSFIRSLERSGGIMILGKLSLIGEQADKDRVSLRLQLTTYFLSDKS
jgi:type IV pilus assembly protein PilO